MSFFRQGALSMHYQVIEGVLARDTLFIHGNVASNRWWQPMLRELRARPQGKGAAILAEWRGCGQTSEARSWAELEMSALAQDYLLLLEELQRKNVDVVGHSTGGLIALLAMAHKPQWFHRCVLLDSVLPSGVEFSEEQKQAFLQMRDNRGFCEMVMTGTIHDVQSDDPFFQQLVDDAFHMSSLNWEGIPRALSRSYSEELGPLDHPTLFIQGELDAVLPASAARSFCEHYPVRYGSLRYFEVRGHGHSLNVENSSVFVDLLEEFLR